MKYDKKYLHDKYNATSTDDGNGNLETYENWLERQLILRLEKIDELVFCQCKNPNLITLKWCGVTIVERKLKLKKNINL